MIQTAVTIMKMMTLTATTSSLLLLLFLLLNVIGSSRTIEVMKTILKRSQGLVVSLRILVMSLPLPLNSLNEVILTLLMTNLRILPIAAAVAVVIVTSCY